MSRQNPVHIRDEGVMTVQGVLERQGIGSQSHQRVRAAAGRRAGAWEAAVVAAGGRPAGAPGSCLRQRWPQPRCCLPWQAQQPQSAAPGGLRSWWW